ncbi:MAG TPA: DUF664 domain-containing protein [Anaerolineaceae bacterium]|nr:DUF664 domain-containing protein [Anaerolineaceae bacterium]
MLSELENYLFRIKDLHTQIIEMIDGIPRDGLNFIPISLPQLQVSNSLANLTAHIAGAEHYWIGEVIGGLPATRDREAEFALKVKNASWLIDNLNAVLAETNTIFSRLTESDLSKIYRVEDKDVPGRWAILHVVEHTALHWGHMQITYQLWAKGDSKPSPFWFSRLPPR